MWGGGNVNAQFGAVYYGPDCLQPRCRAKLVDPRSCDGIHSRDWGGGGVGARRLHVFGRVRGIARHEGCERAVVESAALPQSGAVGAQGEGRKDGDVRSIDQLA